MSGIVSTGSSAAASSTPPKPSLLPPLGWTAIGLGTAGLIVGGLKPYLDSISSKSSELGGPATPCDSLSYGVAFEAEPAKLGEVLLPYTSSAKCPPETDPAKDSCDK